MEEKIKICTGKRERVVIITLSVDSKISDSFIGVTKVEGYTFEWGYITDGILNLVTTRRVEKRNKEARHYQSTRKYKVVEIY